mmetsp:Transcript_39842/g.66086  ORF Transcript_39842/g.66086 Transcript_39842/m.66086 type:complete len:223 (+) Transcript_39842:1730-2398(+)
MALNFRLLTLSLRHRSSCKQVARGVLVILLVGFAFAWTSLSSYLTCRVRWAKSCLRLRRPIRQELLCRSQRGGLISYRPACSRFRAALSCQSCGPWIREVAVAALAAAGDMPVAAAVTDATGEVVAVEVTNEVVFVTDVATTVAVTGLVHVHMVATIRIVATVEAATAEVATAEVVTVEAATAEVVTMEAATAEAVGNSAAGTGVLSSDRSLRQGKLPLVMC